MSGARFQVVGADLSLACAYSSLAPSALLFQGGLSSILASQGRDGGWGYRGGSSWTEPTVYALLAQQACRVTGDAFMRGLEWLRRTQRPDGGWAPNPSVDQGTWVTALVLLLIAERPGTGDPGKAAQWLLNESGRESSFIHRLRQWLLGASSEEAQSYAGWPWYPGTAAWVTPTALTVLALEKVQRRSPAESIRERIEAGRQFLLSRRCADGGWNHGSTRALGYRAGSYPETTGLALLALHGLPDSRLSSSLATAEEGFRRCRSAEGLSWIRLGLLAHGRSGFQFPPGVMCRTVVDAALWVLAEAAAQGNNVFLS